MDAIAIHDVSKTFGGHTAVDGLSLSVPRGSLYGFIGPNGSGKTTTLRMIMHILLPDRGEIEVLGGHDTRAARDRVGYLPEERGLYKKMKVRRLLRYYGRLKGARSPELDRAIDEWLERMGLAGWVDKKVEALSKGMAQKVQFIAAVVSGPELLILDEPFSGLDPVNAEVLKDAVLDLEARRHDGRLLHPRHGRGRADVRPHLHDLPGPQGPRRHARRDPGGLRPRHGPRPDRGRRPRRWRGSARSRTSTTTATSRRSAGAATRRTCSTPWPPARRSTTSRSPGRRCTTSSSASPRPSRWRSHVGKIGIIASTEFAAAVRTKAFLVGIFLMPLLMIGSIVIQTVVAERVDTKPRRFAVVDRSGVLYPTIRTVAAAWNDVVEGKAKRDDPRLPSMSGRRRTSAGPRFEPSLVAEAGRSLDELRLELSDRVRRGELFAFVEIPEGILDPERGTDARILYHTDSPNDDALMRFLDAAINGDVRLRRFQAAGISPTAAERLSRPVPTEVLGLLTRAAGRPDRACARRWTGSGRSSCRPR